MWSPRCVIDRPTTRRSLRCVVLWLFIGPFAGCGTQPIPIEGTITLDGEPLAGVQVLFDQPQASDGKSFAGKTDDRGRFVLHRVGDDPGDQVAGNYRVTLTTAVADRDATEHTPLPPERIPKQYRHGSLQFEVPAGGTDSADFVLMSR